MIKRASIGILTASFLIFGVGLIFAQDSSEDRGEIFGAVYEDMNSNGICVDSGVAGENPVAGIDIEFVSSDEDVVITLQTGSDGTYGLVAAGQSIWRVTAKPDANEWVVTSENPLYPPVLPETGLTQTDVNFCIQQGGTETGNAVIILPESGAADTTPVWLSMGATLGIGFIAVGIFLELRRRQKA